ncbi:AAA family ATPase [Sphaerospermopsis aphanizomenoides BCCUSP55]|uniref:AAA family ATPase n=1 Tax=Sphaerospermopsis aphanizomenoides TaxID=459663 RepID=UPI001903B8E6|nr:ATP-binding protein [Sphaerospermopsis aphanizomenoides]MBK1987750.1 AAA family ATPase [Sphaerospermopsis aphanizomenoides BCCUSP55]
MITKLRLERFKNFKEAELHLGDLTLIVGTNASGKSNIRDAFRFLHGLARGYKLAEIFGEKWVEGGVLQWRGIRGGTREVTFVGEETFALEVELNFLMNSVKKIVDYGIEVNSGHDVKVPEFKKQKFLILGEPPITERITFSIRRSLLHQNAEILSPNSEELKARIEAAKEVISFLSSMRFLDLNPDAMRQPSIPGQTILGDRGENLSSVLQDICLNPERKQTLLQWMQELTPMDVVDFEFPTDFTGRTLLTLVEKNGTKISAISASDGTLRFLAMIAALLGSEPAKLYFFEEIDNGIHPTRLHLLLQLIERQVSQGKIQVVATTHSPQLLRLLSPQSLEYASLTYRLADRPDAKIKRILDIPEAKRVIQEQDLARLHESGWLEDAVEFLEDEEIVE